MTTISIDPDVSRSGVATYEGSTLSELQCLGFYPLLQFLEAKRPGMVLLEAGWLNKSNFHLSYTNKQGKKTSLSAAAAAQAGERVGRNFQTGILIAEFCEGVGIPCRLIKPASPNLWKDDAAMFTKITGWKGRTNPEMRDAAMIGWLNIKK